ncbi:MAG: hypothetical protein ACYTAF_02900 [Planctomycetota bacterium]|jgi:hypothetical protein
MAILFLLFLFGGCGLLQTYMVNHSECVLCGRLCTTEEMLWITIEEAVEPTDATPVIEAVYPGPCAHRWHDYAGSGMFIRWNCACTRAADFQYLGSLGVYSAIAEVAPREAADFARNMLEHGYGGESPLHECMNAFVEKHRMSFESREAFLEWSAPFWKCWQQMNGGGQRTGS